MSLNFHKSKNMNTEERIRKQKELIEEIGRYFDKEGFQPIAGRILGLLMVMDKEQFTFDEIIEELQISKSSASNALKNLEIRGNIEYVTLPGDRKRYFRIKKQDTLSLFEDMEKKIQGMNQLLEYIIELKADKNSGNSIFYKEIISVTKFALESFSKIKDKLKQKKA